MSLTQRAIDFSTACYEQNSVHELLTARDNDADATDIAEWNLSEAEYFAAIDKALDERLEYDENPWGERGINY